MNRLFITGDTHGMNDIRKLTNKNFPIQEELDKSDVLCIAGDAAICWTGGDTDKQLQKWYEDKPFTTLVIDGNHEGHELLSKLPIIKNFKGKVRKVSNSVFYAIRGEIYEINGKSILTLGGADSIDKHLRIKDVDWWEQESITQKDFNNALNNLERYNYDVDYFITHTGGSEVVKFLGFDPFPSDKYVDFILDSLSPRTRHYCVHYHVDMVANLRSKILYDAIIELT
jgi:hypothetical protein